MTEDSRDSVRVMMVASGGGHWVELMRLAPALEGCSTAFVTVNRDYEYQTEQFEGSRYYVVRDVTRWNKLLWVQTVFQLLTILLRERPHVVMSTGALPGYFALRLARLFGARTVWVDSIANVEELSKSGQAVARYACLWLTQWEHLARPGGPEYKGRVL